MATVVISRIQNRSGTQANFEALYPPGYNGIGGATGTQILQPGEIALCTDTRNIYMGNLNGEYIQVGSGGGSSGEFAPIVVNLPPSPTFVPVPGILFTPTPFMRIIYSIVDEITDDPNQVGTDFSKNGTLEITSVVYVDANSVSLTDSGVENNSTAFDVSFLAEYDVDGNIQVSYKHDFPDDLTLSTSSLIWLPI